MSVEPHASRARGRGFTLLEVLVAVALLAGTTVAVLRIARAAIRATAMDAGVTEALVVAADELARARLAAPPLGRATMHAGELRVDRDVRETIHPALREVRVRVTPPGGAPSIDLVEIVRVPLP